MLWRVGCGLREVMASFCPRTWLSSVDLPTLGRPTMATWPQRRTAASVCCSIITILHTQGDQGRCGRNLFCNAPAGALPLRLLVKQRHLTFDEEGAAMRFALDCHHFIARQLSGT